MTTETLILARCSRPTLMPRDGAIDMRSKHQVGLVAWVSAIEGQLTGVQAWWEADISTGGHHANMVFALTGPLPENMPVTVGAWDFSYTDRASLPGYEVTDGKPKANPVGTQQ